MVTEAATLQICDPAGGDLLGEVTEDARTLKTLVASDDQFRMLVAGVVDYAIFMLTPQGLVASWNAGAEHIKGYKAEEIIGRHISTFYTEPDRANGVPDLALRTAAEQGRYEAEAWRVRKDGAPFFANVVIDAIRDEDGVLVGFAKITRDITERRNAQLELQRANDRLSQATRMEAMGQLTGGVAHDFNNLLMVVAGQVQLLRKRVGEDSKVAQALDAIDLAARRGQDLTRHLLAFARRQRLRPMAVSLTARAESLIELLGASLGPSVELDIDLGDDLWPVELDPGELDLALLNMAVNARDAMPQGGRLSLTARNHTVVADGNTEIAGDYVALTMTDTGVGIPADILERVFEPFFTTKDINKGTGLGLSQVYGFARQAGGWATIDSELGKGARITLFLPRSGLAPGDEAPRQTGEVTSSLTVLVVEDNPEVADVAAGLLELLGHRAELVGNADAALARLARGPAPDLVFSDIVMAGSMDGLGLARTIRERWPDLPILLATGYSRAAERMGGEFPVLAKPYQLADLGRAIAGLFAPA
ncbi:PAS domain S-box-containing protein [Caulobacter ginsengisoli]|uniref:histidine kinase n=1 Tax=Caulobacter ginsengisoli TaxID=400775 RepID=A0ABU0IXD3_9CAUL|nr:ATP-binding protein [Caulobacter ginsengisoli]MDQ0465853.1 PAS domain S-box-containing protein [Caulobacter ginsengisoli]